MKTSDTTKITNTSKDAGRHGVTKLRDLIKMVSKRHGIGMHDMCLVIPFAYQICNMFQTIDTCSSIFDDILAAPDRYMYPSIPDHSIRLLAFRETIRAVMPKTYACLQQLDGLADQHLNKIFVGIFFELLPRQYAMRILDLYMCSGEIVLFRYGVAIITMFKSHVKSQLFRDGNQFWDYLKRRSQSVDFNALSMVAFEDDRPYFLKALKPTQISEKNINALKSKLLLQEEIRQKGPRETFGAATNLYLATVGATWFDDSLWRQVQLCYQKSIISCRY